MKKIEFISELARHLAGLPQEDAAHWLEYYTEMLDDRIDLTGGCPVVHLYPLPALPELLCEGRATGLVARGGVTVDLAWKDGRLTELHYDAPAGVEVIVH